MFHARDSPRLLVCDTGVYMEQNDIGFITVAICGGFSPTLHKYPRLVSIETYIDICISIWHNKNRAKEHSVAVALVIDHDDVIKWKHFPRYWPFVRGIHRSPLNSPHIGQWRGALMFSLICVWINGSVDNHEADYLRRYRAHYAVTVMCNL